MKTFLKNSLAFFIIFFFVEKGCYYFLNQAPKKEYDTRLEQVLEGKMNKDIIILGSSRGADNILAGQIEKETNNSTYNLSFQGSDVTFQSFVLETLLRFNKAPKIVLLSIDDPYLFDGEESLVFRYDRLYPLAKYNYINDVLIAHKKNNILSNFFCLSRINNIDINLKTSKKTSVIPIDNYGSMPLTGQKKGAKLIYDDKIKGYSKLNENKKKIEAFLKIKQLCNQHNIKLFYVFSPSFCKFNSSFYARFTLDYQNDNTILYDSLNPIYKEKEYFYDESHLNIIGATIFTKEISNYINQNK